MNRFNFIPVSDELKIVVDQQFSTEYIHREHVDLEWEKLKARDENLFNGKILYYSGLENTTLKAYEGEYKDWFVYFHNKDEIQNINALAVTGIIRQGNSILLGKRSQKVSQNKGLFDLLPSGSLDCKSKGNYLDQLDLECNEELSCVVDFNFRKKVLGILIDKSDSVADIIVEMETENSLDNFRIKNNEYSALRVLSLENNMASINFSEFSSSTTYLLKYLYYQDLK